MSIVKGVQEGATATINLKMLTLKSESQARPHPAHHRLNDRGHVVSCPLMAEIQLFDADTDSEKRKSLKD